MPDTRRSWPVLGWIGIVAALGASPALGEPASRVAGGRQHTCAVTGAGAVWCWGLNAEGQLGDGTTIARSTPAVVSGLSGGVVAVAAGYSHTCALTSGGAVWCWGRGSSGQLGNGETYEEHEPVAVSGLGTGVVAITAGGYHSCAVTGTGAALCWGSNVYAQIGDGTTTNRSTPTAVSGLGSGVSAIAAGWSHTCALTSAGAAWCWGDNADGELGDGTTTDRLTPVAVSGLGIGVSAVAAGDYHSCAIGSGGAVSCWGANWQGQLGDGTTTSRSAPVAVSGLGTGVTGVAAGNVHSCVVTAGGSARCWGGNLLGQVGDGTTTPRLTPAIVTSLTGGLAEISAGRDHTCVVTAARAVSCWGSNDSGQLGDGISVIRSVPVSVSGLGSGAAAVAAGGKQSCARTAAGAAWCWGDNFYGQLGDGTTLARTAPVAVSGLGTGVVALGVQQNHTCAIATGGALWCWGANAYGQLGDGTTTTRHTPVAVGGLGSGVTAMAGGSYHTCAITSAGALLCWGANSYGQLGDGTTTTRSAPTTVSGLGSGVAGVTAGSHHTCAVTTAGAVLCWGSNYSGQLGDGTTTDRHAPTAVSSLGSGVVAIAASTSHTCAVTDAGALSCWGWNAFGQVGDGTNTNKLVPTPVSGLGSGAASVASGWAHTCARTTAGALLCWGRNDSGQLGDGTTIDRPTPTAVSGFGSGVASIAAGDYHACAVTTAGAAYCWGRNLSGQVGDGRPTQSAVPVPAVGFQPWQSDLDRDGRSDLVWRHAAGGDLWVWRMSGGVPASQTYLGTVADTGWRVYGLGDQTGDGKADLLWRHQTTGALFFWTMDGTTIVSQQYLGSVVPDFVIVGTGDYSGDGKTDVLWRHQTSGELWLWRMNGATLEAATRVATIAPAYAVVASGDVNADGKADILWRHTTNGDVWLWLMNGPVPTSQVYLGTVTDLGYQVAGLADHDRDGRSDVLWHHATSGDVWLWRLDGAAIAAITHVATVGDTDYHVAGVGDYDGDGRADVLWHHATTGAVWVWLMNGGSITSVTQVATVPDVGYQIVMTK